MSENIIWMLESLIIPVTLMLTAFFIWKFPAEFRGMFSYHTIYAEKSPAAWAAAQNYFGKIGFFSNLAALILTIIAFVPVLIVERFQNYGGVVCIFITAAQVVLILVDIFIVEGLLKKNFDKDGNPKNDP